MASPWDNVSGWESDLSSCTVVKDSIHVAAPGSGEVIRVELSSDGRATTQPVAITDGSPSAITFDREGALFVADTHHKAVIARAPGTDAFQVMVDSFEGTPFLCPNSIVTDHDGNLFFTDGGALGESAFGSPNGSLYQISVEGSVLKPLLHRCLSGPSCVAVSSNGAILYVAEAALNRVVRLLRNDEGVYTATVFTNLSGGTGPSAMCTDSNGNVYVFCGDSATVPKAQGRLQIFDASGSLLKTVPLNGLAPSGSAAAKEHIYMTEGRMLYRASIQRLLE